MRTQRHQRPLSLSRAGPFLGAPSAFWTRCCDEFPQVSQHQDGQGALRCDILEHKRPFPDVACSASVRGASRGPPAGQVSDSDWQKQQKLRGLFPAAGKHTPISRSFIANRMPVVQMPSCNPPNVFVCSPFPLPNVRGTWHGCVLSGQIWPLDSPKIAQSVQVQL